MARGLCATSWLLVLMAAAIGNNLPAAEVDAKVANKRGLELFEKKIRPVLVVECLQCHSQEAQQQGKLKGGLLLDSAEGLLAGGDSGPAIVPKSAKSSLLVHALRHDDLEMPPKKKLPEQVIKDFEAWINLGAPEPRKGQSAAATVAKNSIDIEAGRQFWSFQPPKKLPAPTVKNKAWPRGEVDKFVLAELEAKQLKPVADADRQVLARRVYLDLIGLPPTPEQVDEFVNDRSPKALETLVDRLLQSPHFGERWGRHWLDIARFAESNGNVDNNLFPHAWRYRDYVINAFNSAKPYDRFLTEQLAGDLLPSDSPEQQNELLIATGFLALTSKPRPQNNPDFAMDLVADQIEVTTTALMGLTVACARCHDHKFDPVPMTDYYALAGFFTSSDMLYGVMTRNNKKKDGDAPKVHSLVPVSQTESSTPLDPKELQSLKDQEAALDKEVAVLRRQLQKIGNQQKKIKKANKANAEKVPEETSKQNPKRRLKLAESELNEKVKQLETVRAKIAEMSGTPKDSGQFAMGVRDLSKASDCSLCIRGESAKRGPTVPRGFVSVACWSPVPNFTAKTSGRRELAEWLTSPQHPLTSRVMVNRIWQHLFGVGLVSTPDNFGAHGEWPSHPVLLDHLAVQFVENGWSVKRLIRELVLTRTYTLSSQLDGKAFEVDPDNRLLWRHSPRRLDAEIIRDSALFVSGELNLTPLKGTLIEKHGSDEVRNDLGQQIARIDVPHRSVYLPVVRNNAPETLEPFDMADSSLVIGARDVTTVPAQALFLMNSPFVLKRSESFAKRLLSASGDDAGRVELAYRLALGRSADSEERQRALAFIEQMRASITGGRDKDDAVIRDKAWSSFCQSLFSSAEFRYMQ